MQITGEVFVTARPGNYIFEGPTEDIPLNVAGNTSTTFSGSGRFTIFYSAECACGLPPRERPTGGNNDDTFCSAHSAPDFEFEGAVMAAAMGRTASLPSGTHTVRIRARTVNSDGAGLLGDSSLLITD